MERIMLGGEEFQRLFNCSFYSVDSIPLEKRSNVRRGIIEITFSSILMILYMPCLVSIWSRREHSCYRYMFAMGVLDQLHMLFHGPLEGIYNIIGVVYCSSPTLSYCLSALMYLIHITEVNTELLLAINRCMYFAMPDLALRVFPEDKQWTWFWLLIPLVIGILYSMFGALTFFSGIHEFYALNPHFGYADDMYKLYISDWRIKLFTTQCYVMMIGLPAVYLIFVLAVLKHTCAIKTIDVRQRTSPKSIFTQVAIISFFNCTYLFIAVYLENLTKNELMGMTVLMWFFYFSLLCMNGFDSLISFMQYNKGIPPVIYLSLNKSIQRDVWRMLTKICSKVNKNQKHVQNTANNGNRNSHQNRGRVMRRMNQNEQRI